jgi:hypothetical protein
MEEVIKLILNRQRDKAVDLFILKRYSLKLLAEDFEYTDLTKWDLILFADYVIKQMRDNYDAQ